MRSVIPECLLQAFPHGTAHFWNSDLQISSMENLLQKPTTKTGKTVFLTGKGCYTYFPVGTDKQNGHIHYNHSFIHSFINVLIYLALQVRHSCEWMCNRLNGTSERASIRSGRDADTRRCNLVASVSVVSAGSASGNLCFYQSSEALAGTRGAECFLNLLSVSLQERNK